MADPALQTLVQNAWTLVAFDITTGIINLQDPRAAYYVTHVDTGNSAPSNTPNPGEVNFIGTPIVATRNKAAGVDQFKGTAFIESTIPIDVYMYTTEAPGRIRKDL